MYCVSLQDGTSLEEFRGWAKRLIAAQARPGDVAWRVGADCDLFSGKKLPDTIAKFTVPSAFVELAGAVLCHRDEVKLPMLYDLLWRLQNGERQLLTFFADPLVHKLRRMQKIVRHDMHKMTAFVRFRCVEDEQGERFIAWFEPQHLILRRISDFFVNRFASMRWSILTPDGTIDWDTRNLSFGPGVSKSHAPAEDKLEEWWLTYYKSTFNPARANIKAMRAEMPAKYWHNLPEATLIPKLLAEAPARAKTMIESPALAPRAVAAPDLPADAAPAQATSLEALKAQAAVCRRCPLHCHATQTVFGEGPQDARMVFVGEQPGDQEDLAGKPFVGPAGQVFDRAVAAAGIDRKHTYVTNAVKHFKFQPKGKRRIHQKPNSGEIEHCRWWLDRELSLIKPQLVVGLGATAGRALLGRDVKVMQERGQVMPGPHGSAMMLTVHPSFLLRIADPVQQREEQQRFVRDLGFAAAHLLMLRGAA